MTSLPVIIIGVNSFALEVANIFQKNNVVIYGFLEDDPKKKDAFIGEIPVLGSTEDEQYWSLIGKNCNVFVALENPIERKKMIETIIEDCKTKPVNAIHPEASIADVHSIGYGIFLGNNAIIQPSCRIGDHCVIGAGVIVETGVILEEFVQIGSGSVIGKEAKIENNAFVGINATIVGSIKIGKSASIGAGSVVIENLPNSKRVFGNPAKIV
ncbi:MAG: UDP-3-O-acylglucosamine N-acyltransferase [Bacteroidota bacterium]|jgi:sugar O-acyltransferase (sialic acid O-acetyltransferase NeuD family)